MRRVKIYTSEELKIAEGYLGVRVIGRIIQFPNNGDSRASGLRARLRAHRLDCRARQIRTMGKEEAE